MDKVADSLPDPTETGASTDRSSRGSTAARLPGTAAGSEPAAQATRSPSPTATAPQNLQPTAQQTKRQPAGRIAAGVQSAGVQSAGVQSAGVQSAGAEAAPVRVLRPVRQSLPIVVSSPHSGRHYPDDLLARTGLDERTLRSSEDSFVDELFAAVPELGAPLVAATFPRVYVDANREPYELDPAMFSDPLPAYVTTRNARIAAGLGTIARVVSNAVPVYAGKLSFDDAVRRIEGYWRPYHAALTQAIEETRDRFGYCILVDAHSMPSNVHTVGSDGRSQPVADIVLGDCHGTSCSPVMTSRVERLLSHQGYRVRRNLPYAGGYVTRHYGRPELAVHALQIEVKRGLYMDERRLQRTPGLARVAADMRRAIAGLASFDPRRPLGDAD